MIDSYDKLPLGKYMQLLDWSRQKDIEDIDRQVGILATLAVPRHIGQIVTGQYLDFQAYAKDPLKNMPQLLAVLLVPKGHKYGKDYDVLTVADAIRDNLSVSQANGLLAFFFERCRLSMRNILLYSAHLTWRIRDREKRREMKAQVKNLLTLFSNAGGGLRMWTVLPRPADARGSMSRTK